MKNLLSLQKWLSDLKRNSAIDAKFLGYLRKVEDNLNSNPFNLVPTVHTNGAVRFKDNSPALHFSQPKMRPRNDSDAISSIGLDLAHTLIVSKIEGSGHVYTLHTCPRTSSPTSPVREEELVKFVGIGLDFMVELIPITGDESLMKGCGSFKVKDTQSFFFQQNTAALPRLLYIIPVKESFTLYVDNGNELRYASFQGVTQKENQPLASHVRKLSFSIAPDLYIPGLSVITAVITHENRTTSTFHFEGRIVPGSMYNYLLNRY